MFTVSWHEPALNEFTEMYVTFDLHTQRRVSSAIEALIRRLERDPLEVGESRSGNARIAFTDLMAVRFTVDQSAKVVRIRGIQRYGR